MKYFYIFILTLILITCNEKKGYSGVEIEYGEEIDVTSDSECRKVVEKGKILSTYFSDGVSTTKSVHTRILYKNFIYKLRLNDFYHICYWKRKFYNK